MTARLHSEEILQEIARYWKPRPTGSASQWAEQTIVIPSGPRPGQLSFRASEYLREPIDFWSEPFLTDMVMCFGSQTGKTMSIKCGVAWSIMHSRTSVLWVMDAGDNARAFSKDRWCPMWEASPELEKLVPRGKERFDFAASRQRINGSIVTFVGSNSPGKLASKPCRVVVLDETDKYPDAGNEADPISLAVQRTKRFTDPKRVKTSTPTTTDKQIWQQFLLGDQRRYLTPCPHCGKMVLWSWSKDFSLLSRTGCEAYVKWDDEAKGADGLWDLERVFASARFECPFCAGHIREEHKTKAVREGRWLATAKAPPGYRSYHLPSYFASSPQTSFGHIAVAFLRGKESLEGLQAFITGELAEPWESQDARSERTELVSDEYAEPLQDAVPIMTVDCQAVSPHFWVVVRAWNVAGASRLVGTWRCDDFETVRRIQLACGVIDKLVCLDSGDEASKVYEECLRFGVMIPSNSLWIGWTPSKGRDHNSKWVHEKTKTVRPYTLSSAALQGQEKRRLPLLLFNGDHILGLLAKMRRPIRDNTSPRRWEAVSLPAGPEVDGAVRVETDEYWRHLDSKLEKPLVVGRTNKIEWRWVKRTKKWPEHLLDCEIMQIAMAMLHRRFPVGTPIERDTK